MHSRMMLFSAIFMFAAALAVAANSQEATTERSTQLGETTLESLEEEASRWQLTTEEYQRYLRSLEGPRGRLSDPTITPIEVLGIEAKSAAERSRYARMWVEMIRHDTAKTLAWTRGVHDAWLEIAPDRKLIDPMLLQKLKLRRQSPSSSVDHEPSRHIMFTSLACASCNIEVARLLEDIGKGGLLGLDIFIVGDAPNDEVQAWAKSQRLPIDWVQQGTVTLNRDQGELQTLKAAYDIETADFPIVMRRDGEGYELVSNH